MRKLHMCRAMVDQRGTLEVLSVLSGGLMTSAECARAAGRLLNMARRWPAGADN